MKISYHWLKELVKFNYNPQQLADHLTMLGLEVELVVPVKLFFSGVKTGRILSIEPHPNADKLLLCQVTTGTDTLSIVCGAHNISVGDLVPVAVPGAILPDNIKITKRTIRGVESSGMLCSERELGISDRANGIFILSRENLNGIRARPGKMLEEAAWLNDTILDVNVTPNRGDALSILGIAREISTLCGQPVKLPQPFFSATGPLTSNLVNVRVKATRRCPRYTARVITDIAVKTAPFWIRYRLNLLGIRSINNIVDITNYVLLETGQPLHAFDYNAINGKKIIVRTALPGEKIITIDNKSRNLDKDTLVICDVKTPIAIAGIMGGAETEVNNSTKNILLESAYFESGGIRKISKRTGLITESSYRFERGIDPRLAPVASRRAVGLILSLAGGSASGKIIDLKKDLPIPRRINLKSSYINHLIGIEVPLPKCAAILSDLGCTVSKTGSALSVKPPSWRTDLKEKVDLVEEIARVSGYTKIPPALPSAQVKSPHIRKIQKLVKKIYTILPAMGLDEIITYSFIDPAHLTSLGITPDVKQIKLINPVDQNVCVMRPTLIPGIINTINYNLNRGNNSLGLFELGRCFSLSEKNNPPRENLHLSIGICGPTGGADRYHWQKSGTTADFFDLKGILQQLFNDLLVANIRMPRINHPLLHSEKACGIILDGCQIGLYGQINPRVLKKFASTKSSPPVYVAELDVTKLLEAVPDSFRFLSLPKFPAIRRDFSIILDRNTESHGIIRLIEKTGSPILESVVVSDVYQGDQIPENKKSVTYTLIYRHKARTLTDEEVDNIHNTLRETVLKEFPAGIRD